MSAHAAERNAILPERPDWPLPDDPIPARVAQLVGQSVPPSMVAGLPYDVTVTMRNSGSETWTPQAAHRLGAQNPQDNGTWGFGRVDVPGAIAAGQDATSRFRVTAPATPGTHN
jgi:hypothetical protein